MAGDEPLDSEQPDPDEQALLDRILVAGYDQGCFIRPSATDLVSASSDEVSKLIDQAACRAPCEPGEDDPFEVEPIAGVDGIDGEQDGWVILSQRCDLIRGLRDEPLVELARCSLIEDDVLITQAKVNSPRLIHLCDHGDRAWVVDLRLRAFLPKGRLLDHDVVLPISAGRPRRDFALRVGRRYSRDAIPDDIVEGIQKPLSSWLKGSNGRRRKTKMFSEFLAVRSDDGVLLLAVIGPDQDRVEAERAGRELIDGFRNRVSGISAKSAPVTAGDVPLGMWKDAHKLDLDALSRGRRADEDTATPNR